MNTIKNPVFFWLLIVFSLLNLADLATAFFILPGEANPLYILFDTIWVVILLKVCILSILWYYYHRNKYPNNMTYFIFILMVILGIVVVGLALKSNIYGVMHPAEVEYASTLPDSEKVSAFFLFSALTYFLPFIASITAFWFYERSLNKTDINKEYFKKREWWKL